MLISKGETLSTSDAVMRAVLCQSVRTQNKCLSSFFSRFKDLDNEIFSLFTDLDIAVLPANFSFLFPAPPLFLSLFAFIEQTVTKSKNNGIG